MIDFKSSKSLNLSIQNYGSTGTFSKLKVKPEVGILDDHMVWSPRVHTYTETRPKASGSSSRFKGG